MGGEKKRLVMSDLGCARGCGRQMGAENCVDGCGRRGCNGVAGNGWGEEAAGDERPWLRGRLRTANGCGELRGRLRTAWVQGGWLEIGGEKKAVVMGDLGCADGCGRQMGAENCADGCGRRGCNGVAGNGWGEGKGRERMGTILMSCILRLGLPRDAQWDARWDATEGVNTMKAFNNP